MSSRVLSGGEEDDIPDITLYLSSGTKFYTEVKWFLEMLTNLRCLQTFKGQNVEN